MIGNVASIVVLRVVATALSLGLAAWAVSGIISLSASDEVRTLATIIESGGEPRLENFDQLNESDLPDRILSQCNTSNLHALATVRLKELDIAYVVADPARADQASQGAEAAIRKSLTCAPLNGMFWLRIAILDTARRGASSTTVRYLKLSHWTTPSEGWVVRSRVDFTGLLFEAGIRDVEAELRSDIRTLINYDADTNIAEMYLAAPGSVRIIFREWIALLPEGRRKSVTRAVDDRGGHLNAT
jgi:hypothetical protein